MDVSKPYQGLFPTVDSDVLSVLSRSERPFSGREIAKRSGRSHTAVQAVLDRLLTHGLVTQQRGGNALLYVLNRKHLAAGAIQQLASLRGALVARLREAVGGWEVAPLHASLFGSAARGDGGIDSDIDVLIIRPGGHSESGLPWGAQVDALTGAIPRWTGNAAGLIEIGELEVPRLRIERAGVIEGILREGVDLGGTPARKYFSGRDGT